MKEFKDEEIEKMILTADMFMNSGMTVMEFAHAHKVEIQYVHECYDLSRMMKKKDANAQIPA